MTAKCLSATVRDIDVSNNKKNAIKTEKLSYFGDTFRIHNV